MISYFYSTLMVLVLYIFLYNPVLQVFDFGLIKLLWPISFIYVFTSKSALRYLFEKKYIIVAGSILLIYALTVAYRNPDIGISRFRALLSLFVECTIIPIALSMFAIKRGLNLQNMVIFTSLTAAAISLTLLAIPELNRTMRDTYVHDVLDAAVVDFDLYFRGFSISEGSSFSYPIVQSMVAVFVLMSNGKFSIVVSIIIFLSAIINARISIVIFTAGVLSLVRQENRWLRFIVFSTTISFIGAGVYNFQTQFELESTVKWVSGFFEESISFYEGDDFNTYAFLASDFYLIFALDMDLFFGRAIDLFAGYSLRSDVGYISQLYFGGIVYLFMLIFFWGAFLNYGRKAGLSKGVLLFFGSILLISNLKGVSLDNSSGFVRTIALFLVMQPLLLRSRQ